MYYEAVKKASLAVISLGLVIMVAGILGNLSNEIREKT